MSNRPSQAVSHNNAQSTKPGEAEYFDLHTRGCGYLSRVRWVNTTSRGRKSDPFLCCAINALHGEVDDPSYSYFDLRVTGTDAQQIIASLEQHVVQNKKVFVAFGVGDIYAHPYERKVKDPKTGNITGKEWTALIKGRLLQVTHVKVDGVTIYSAAGNTDAEPENDSGYRKYADDADSAIPL